MEQYITNSETETLQLGRKLVGELNPGQVVALYGGLGMGKTVLVKGIAAGLGIDDMILSPTFTLLRQYPGLNHFDIYRIGEPDELEEIGFEELISGNAISVIEWAERAEDLLPTGTIRIRMTRGENDNQRVLTREIKEDI